MNIVVRPLRFWRSLLSVALCCSAPLLGSGQSTDVDRAQLLRAQTDLRTYPYTSDDGVSNGHAVASPNDPDLGEQQILKRQDRYQPLTFSAGVPFYYTSNVALVREGEQGDFLVAPVASVAYEPRLSKTFFGHISVQQQMFYYNRFSDLNFGSFDVRAGFFYYLPTVHNLLLRAEYQYNRLTFADDFDEFFSNHALFFGAEMPFRMGRALQLTVGIDANISLAADPEEPRRNDFDFYLAYDAQLTRALSLDAAARLVVRDYSETDRADVSEIFSLSANYRLAPWLTLSAIGTFAANQSNHSVFDYTVGNIGGAVGVTCKF